MMGNVGRDVIGLLKLATVYPSSKCKKGAEMLFHNFDSIFFISRSTHHCSPPPAGGRDVIGLLKLATVYPSSKCKKGAEMLYIYIDNIICDM